MRLRIPLRASEFWYASPEKSTRLRNPLRAAGVFGAVFYASEREDSLLSQRVDLRAAFRPEEALGIWIGLGVSFCTIGANPAPCRGRLSNVEHPEVVDELP